MVAQAFSLCGFAPSMRYRLERLLHVAGSESSGATGALDLLQLDKEITRERLAIRHLAAL
jgi:hypothetical protein